MVEIGYMPIIKSAKKALRQSKRRGKRNLVYKNKIKAIIKDIKGLISGKKIEEARKLLPNFYKILDKAAKVEIIKKNTASRKKSKIVKLINKSQISAKNKSSAT